ncbi:uncharacterized protein LOC124359372 [Homalodisca vitripennis]|nr:uncharacterized protein LOC124359372 [Homalodisca vitripennis]XP_046668021.1 uncharacterized protein LOC124359372 [Homalodisca vitripennis]KAG8262243.1 hypothetical protein J6590_056306 [Homalodisca vitripennis]
MIKKRSKKILFSKTQSKTPPKLMEEEFYSESVTTEPNLQKMRRPSKNPVSKRKDKFRKQYEYSEFEDPYDEYTDGYDRYQNNMLSEGYEDYTTEDSYRYRHRPGHSRMYMTETVTEDYDSDDRWKSEREVRDVDNWREMTEPYMSDLASEDSYQEQHLRGRKERSYDHKRRKDFADSTENETSLYGGEYNVFVADEPVGHQVFRYKRESLHRAKHTESSDTSDSESVTEKDVTESTTTNNKKYTVYAADVGHSAHGAFQREQTKKKVLSTSKYENGDPPKAIGQETMTRELHKIQSEIVYLPVLMLDKTAKSKLISSGSIIKQTGEQPEKPLESKMQVYVAQDMEQNNIFVQAQHPSIQDPEIVQNITVYSADQEESSPMKPRLSKMSLRPVSKESLVHRQKSKVMKPQRSMSLRPRKYIRKGDLDHNPYPVQKSYINMLSRLKSKEKSNKKASGINFKRSLSRLSQKLDLSKTDQTNVKTQENTNQSKHTKNTNDSSGPEEPHVTQKIHTLKSSSCTNFRPSHTNIHTSTYLNSSPMNLYTTTQQDQNVDILASRQSATKSSFAVPTQSTKVNKRSRVMSKDIKKEEDIRKSLKPSDTVMQPVTRDPFIEELKPQPTPVIDQQCQIREVKNHKLNKNSELKLQPHKVLSRKASGLLKKSESKQLQKVLSRKSSGLLRKSESKETNTHPKEKKSTISRIFGRKQKNKEINNEFLEFTNEDLPENYHSEAVVSNSVANQPQQRKLKRKHTTEKRPKIIPKHEPSQHFIDNTDISKISKQMWGVNQNFLILLFQTAQFFLGLSIHEKLMDVIAAFKSNDQISAPY